ncbi:hypothetical protein ACQZ61_20890 [Agrobacterium vitis]|uniref:hypothetical protein n=1 Tax=Agrobacterium vitis TaxID=373 RepID=UPI0015DAA269|nr:hypothetical protein [Agrobacterium vitis]MCF1455327.1 hypothetical protein [Agrobacterium vitis]
MKKLFDQLGQHKIEVCLKLQATEVVEIEKKSELLPDFEFVSYGGLSEKDYPIWHEFEFGDEFLFIHRLKMPDYGYFVDDAPEDYENYELPKYTSGTAGYGEAGILKLELHSVDRFGCRAMIRGSLSGSSIEMNMDVRFKFIAAGYRIGETRLGYAAEAIAEGCAFEEEGKLKQAFFSYYAALDSFIDAERVKLNGGLNDDEIDEEIRKDIILPDIRLNEKLRHVVKRNLPTNLNGLNGLRVWGEVFSRFNQITETRNAIAHNTKIAAITKDDVKVCFSTLAIIVAIVQEQCFDEAAILECYGLS